MQGKTQFPLLNSLLSMFDPTLFPCGHHYRILDAATASPNEDWQRTLQTTRAFTMTRCRATPHIVATIAQLHHHHFSRSKVNGKVLRQETLDHCAVMKKHFDILTHQSTALYPLHPRPSGNSSPTGPQPLNVLLTEAAVTAAAAWPAASAGRTPTRRKHHTTPPATPSHNPWAATPS